MILLLSCFLEHSNWLLRCRDSKRLQLPVDKQRLLLFDLLGRRFRFMNPTAGFGEDTVIGDTTFLLLLFS